MAVVHVDRSEWHNALVNSILNVLISILNEEEMKLNLAEQKALNKQK